MPLYDFRCRTCGHGFEGLVRAGSVLECPSCHGQDLERLLSTFAVASAERTRTAADKNIKKAAATARLDNIALDKEIEQHRRDDL